MCSASLHWLSPAIRAVLPARHDRVPSGLSRPQVGKDDEPKDARRRTATLALIAVTRDVLAHERNLKLHIDVPCDGERFGASRDGGGEIGLTTLAPGPP
jgi:hypothetical protein